MNQATPLVFLAMFWGGGGPFSIRDLILVYDWVNRDVLSRDEMEHALNYLLAAGVIERENGEFRIEKTHLQAFQQFRRKRRKGRFELAELYVRKLPEIRRPKRVIKLGEKAYELQLAESRRAFKRSKSASNKAEKQLKHGRKTP